MQKEGKLDFIGARAYLDLAIELMQDNEMNSAILNYAIKVLAGQELTRNAEMYCVKFISHLCLIYPYLVPLLEKNVFNKFDVPSAQIGDLSQRLYKKGLEEKNYEVICYSLYYAMKWNFSIKDINPDDVIASSSCLFKLFAYLYFEKISDNNARKKMKEHARKLALNEDDFGRNWLFVYESLPQSNLKGEWKSLKKAGVSFVRKP